MTSEPSSSAPEVKPLPDGLHAVTPHLCCAGASDAIDFYVPAFDATEVCKVPRSDGKLMHGAIRIGDSTIFLHDEFPGFGALGPKACGGSSVTIHLQVEDADAAFYDARVTDPAEIHEHLLERGYRAAAHAE